MMFVVILMSIFGFIGLVDGNIYMFFHSYSSNCTEKHCFNISDSNPGPETEIPTRVVTRIPILIVEENSAKACKDNNLFSATTKIGLVYNSFFNQPVGKYDASLCPFKVRILPENTTLKVKKYITFQNHFIYTNNSANNIIVSDDKGNQFEMYTVSFQILKDIELETNDRKISARITPMINSLIKIREGQTWDSLLVNSYKICGDKSMVEDIITKYKIDYSVIDPNQKFYLGQNSCVEVKFNNVYSFQKALLFFDELVKPSTI